MSDNLQSGSGTGGWLRLRSAEAYRRGWESARKGEAFDALAHDRMEQFEAANYENGRLIVLEGRRLGLDDVPAYPRLSKRTKVMNYIGIGPALAVKPTPKVADYMRRVLMRGRLEGAKLLPKRTTHLPPDETLSFSVVHPGRRRLSYSR